MRRLAAIGILIATFVSVELHAQSRPTPRPNRASLIARAQLWAPTDVAAKNLRLGPPGPQAFAPGETVRCDYLDKRLDGNSRKFACVIAPGDEIKVKFGQGNGEVEGEVAGTRLLWALGFAADQMYPARVVCRGCPKEYGVATANPNQRLVDPATIERKLPWKEVVTGDRPGWSWAELELIDDAVGGAPKAHRDALKLLAVLMQHTDTKPEQQRLLCLDEQQPTEPFTCKHPFVMLNDLGLTFGRAHLSNSNLIGSVNLADWEKTPIWKNPTGCVGNLPKSFTGTLKDPLIGEEGRQFLVRLLSQLSDQQIHDLFAVARVDLRGRSPIDPHSAPASVDEWVRVFKAKRAEIAGRRCTEPWSVAAPLLFKTGPNVWLQMHSSRARTTFMNAVSFLGYTGIYSAIAVMLTFGFRLRAGVALFTLLALNAVLVDAGKIVASYPRPDSVDSRVESLSNGATDSLARIFDAEESAVSVDADDGYGFPSGHAASATALAFGLAFLFRWRWAWLLLVTWMPLVATSRMYLGRHFLGDVVGGIGVGIITVAAAFLGLALTHLQETRSAPRAARHLLITAVSLTVFALWIRLPGAYDAGRFLGVAAAVFLFIRSGVPDTASWGVSLGRLMVSMLIFPATAWLVALVLDAVGKAHEPVGALLAGALPTAMLLIGPVYLPRTLTLTRKSPLLSPR